jgi:hypothetical protein
VMLKQVRFSRPLDVQVVCSLRRPITYFCLTNATVKQTIQRLYDLRWYTIQSYNIFISFHTKNSKITNKYQFCKASVITKH